MLSQCLATISRLQCYHSAWLNVKVQCYHSAWLNVKVASFDAVQASHSYSWYWRVWHHAWFAGAAKVTEEGPAMGVFAW